MAVFNLPVMILSDRTAPVISGTSVGNPLSIDENIAASSLVATMLDDGTAVSYAIVSGNTNGDFAIANNGDITVVNSPDYETTSSYSLGITATDSLGNTSTPFTVTININDIDEIPPVVTLVSQPYVAVYETENSLTIASFTASDAGADVTSSLVLSGTPNTTNFSLSYNTSTQQMDLVTSASGLLGGGVTADQTFSFTVSATDAAGNTGSTTCNLVVKNAEAPTITSGASSISRVEGTSTNTTISTYAASGTTPITWSVTGTDANDFTITNAGQLRFARVMDYEVAADRSHSINVVATNQFGSASQAVSVTVTNNTADDVILSLRGTGETSFTNYNFGNVGANRAINGYQGAQDTSSSTPMRYELQVSADTDVAFFIWGAGGGGTAFSAGGRATGIINLKAGTTYYLVVGGGGQRGWGQGHGGYGGGGAGKGGGNSSAYGAGGLASTQYVEWGGGGGGGCSGLFDGVPSNSTALLVAGGGGGQGSSAPGQGGGSSGTNASTSYGGGGGTQTAGGFGPGPATNGGAGFGGRGVVQYEANGQASGGTPGYYAGGGGGGGYYGGGGGDVDSTPGSEGYSGGGGGGSGYGHSTKMTSFTLTAGDLSGPPEGSYYVSPYGKGTNTGDGYGGRIYMRRV